MALFAVLTDDKTAVREIRELPEGTQLKSGLAFPAVIDPVPDFNPKLSYVSQIFSLPVNGTVHVGWAVKDHPQEKLDEIAGSDALSVTFGQLRTIKEKIDGAGGKLEAADQTALLQYTLEALIQLEKPLLELQKARL